MTYILNKDQRHYVMSCVRSKDTKPEVIVRKYLFSKGLRFRKNDRRHPGHPDVLLPKYRTVIFVNGYFWHQHEGCRYARNPATNEDYCKRKNSQETSNAMYKNKRNFESWARKSL